MSAAFFNSASMSMSTEMISSSSAKRELMLGGGLATLLLGSLAVWSFASSLDAAIVSRGVLRPAGTRQIVQAPADGPISAIHVADGTKVRAGQPLLQIAPSEAVARERALAVRKFGLEAEIARLNAELSGATVIAPPASFAKLDRADRQLAEEALATEQVQFAARRSVEGAEIAALRNRLNQTAAQISGNRERMASVATQSALNREELAAYESLFARGLASKPRVLALRRSAAAAEGELGETRSEIARLRSQAGEARLRTTQAMKDRAAATAQRLREAQTELAGLLPQWLAARAQLGRTIIRAPFAGTVTALQVHGSGAMAAAGMKLLEIVPSSGTTTVEAQIAPADVADLAPGAEVRVRLTGHEGSRIAPMIGTIQRISADSVEDREAQRAYYIAVISIMPDELSRVRSELPRGLRAGMPVEVVATTRKRSPIAFLTGPLFERLTRTFTER